jgi:hypothetical protein
MGSVSANVHNYQYGHISVALRYNPLLTLFEIRVNPDINAILEA